jgi:hypothetical protein
MTGQLLGRSLIVIGLVIAALGVVLSVAGNIPYLGKLPGDILVKRDHFTFYFPLTTCIVISLILMLVSRLFLRK